MTNHLAHSRSPYLLQHAHNPVAWWPWCEQALELAVKEDKLILLSIGYSACHWCHVMAHESFEDPLTTEVMNQRYINIKIDREERPDLDKIYQSAHQLLNQRPGGWPLTMILTPDDHLPFFAGTYFPVIAKHGMPSFQEVLIRVDDFYRQNPDQIKEQNQSLQAAMNNFTQPASNLADLNSAPLDQARRQLEQQFDNESAGFGKAPKFPHPGNLMRLLRHWSTTKFSGHEDSRAKEMLTDTLQAMAAGGLFDQLAGGFFRYSVDDQWMIPHFEKMLYDNGPLLGLYAQAASAFNDPNLRAIADATANWVINEMQADQGGFYSSLDADSEGVEGKFYVWTPEQIKALLTTYEYTLFAKAYGLDREANFEGNWHLHISSTIRKTAEENNLNPEQAQTKISQIKQTLLLARNQRIRPDRDEKVLTAWNALMIKNMAQAGRLLQHPGYIHCAQRNCDFIIEHMFNEHRLYASYKDGEPNIMAYLDDYAFLLDAVLELLSAQWQSKYLEFALLLADSLLTHFQDTRAGGFFFTANDHEQLIQRPKPITDEAIPAGNAVAAFALTRLGHLLGNETYLKAGERTIMSAWTALTQAPYAHATMLDALEEYLYPPEIIIIRANERQKEHWVNKINSVFKTRLYYFFIADNETNLHPDIIAKAPRKDHSIAYRCAGTQCFTPCKSVEELLEKITAT